MTTKEEEEEDDEGDDDEAEEEEDETPKEENPWAKYQNPTPEFDEIEWPPEGHDKPQPRPRSEFFQRHETLKTKYNELEIDAFLKILNVKPLSNWADDSLYHHSLGLKTFEDDGQYTDNQYLMHADVERQHVERAETLAFRQGAAIRFNVGGNKQPVFPHYLY